MEVVVVVLVLLTLVVVLAVVARGRRGEAHRDDRARAGHVTPEQAALRAGGSTAWMRQGGPGG